LKSDLEDEIAEIEQLTNSLSGWITEAERRVSEIDDALAGREVAEDAPADLRAEIEKAEDELRAHDN
jgi:hypothetical protein